MKLWKTVSQALTIQVALILVAATSFAQENRPSRTITLDRCEIPDVQVDKRNIGQMYVSLKIDVPSKIGKGNLRLTRRDGSVSDFKLLCKMMTKASYLIQGRFNEFIICETSQPVIKNLTYGIPIWVDEKGIAHVETYTVFNNGEGFSNLVYGNCERTGSTQ